MSPRGVLEPQHLVRRLFIPAVVEDVELRRLEADELDVVLHVTRHLPPVELREVPEEPQRHVGVPGALLLDEDDEAAFDTKEPLINSALRLRASALSSRRRQILSVARYASGLSPREIQRIRANPGHLIESAVPLGFTSEHQLDHLWPPLLVIRFFQSIIVGQAFLVPGRLFYWWRSDVALGIDRGALTFWCNRGRLEIQKSEPPRGGRSDVW